MLSCAKDFPVFYAEVQAKMYADCLLKDDSPDRPGSGSLSHLKDQTVYRIKIEYHLHVSVTCSAHHTPPGLPWTRANWQGQQTKTLFSRVHRTSDTGPEDVKQ